MNFSPEDAWRVAMRKLGQNPIVRKNFNFLEKLFLCFTFPTWMSTLIYQSQKLSTYIYKYKTDFFYMYMRIIFEIGRLK